MTFFTSLPSQRHFVFFSPFLISLSFQFIFSFHYFIDLFILYSNYLKGFLSTNFARPSTDQYDSIFNLERNLM